jgi:hypothetical protein
MGFKEGFSIQVSKDDLLAKLRENRAAHEQAYQTAMEGYVKATIKELETKLERIKAGKEVDRYLKNVAAPASHTDAYDDVIAMLEMASVDQIELSQEMFRQYVQDDWAWKQNWVTSNSAYLS